jgi:hypothetical protein
VISVPLTAVLVLSAFLISVLVISVPLTAVLVLSAFLIVALPIVALPMAAR